MAVLHIITSTKWFSPCQREHTSMTIGLPQKIAHSAAMQVMANKPQSDILALDLARQLRLSPNMGIGGITPAMKQEMAA